MRGVAPFPKARATFMDYVIANPEQKWEGFRPTAYTLNRKVRDLPITEVRCASDGTRQEVATTIIDVYSRFENRPIVSLDYGPDGGDRPPRMSKR